MAKNKNNSFRNSTSQSSKDYSAGSSKNGMGSSTGGSMKDTHAQVPSKGPSRSGPGGE